MHEAGLARGVAKALRERGLGVAGVRLAVRGGHHDAAAFDAEFRSYLAMELPDEAEAVGSLVLERIPFEHLCVACGREFAAPGIAEPCPDCGGDALPGITDEQIEIVPAARDAIEAGR